MCDLFHQADKCPQNIQNGKNENRVELNVGIVKKCCHFVC